jgi:hypothetical protein
MPFLGQSTDRLQFLHQFFVDEGEKLQCSHVIQRQAWRVANFKSQFLSINVILISSAKCAAELIAMVGQYLTIQFFEVKHGTKSCSHFCHCLKPFL